MQQNDVDPNLNTLLIMSAAIGFGIAGGIVQGLMNLFRNHPPLADRIAALEQSRG